MVFVVIVLALKFHGLAIKINLILRLCSLVKLVQLFIHLYGSFCVYVHTQLCF